MGGGIDREPVVAPVVDQVARHRAHRVGTEAATVKRCAEEQIDAGGAEFLVSLLVVLDHPGHLAVDDDREDGDTLVLAARLLEHVLVRQPAPPALDLGIGSELDDPVDVALVERPQDDAISAQFHDGLVTPVATTLSR